MIALAPSHRLEYVLRLDRSLPDSVDVTADMEIAR